MALTKRKLIAWGLFGLALVASTGRVTDAVRAEQEKGSPVQKPLPSAKEHSEVVKALLFNAKYGNSSVRQNAIWGLANLGSEAAGIVPDLLSAVQSDYDEEVRVEAARALGRIGSQPGVVKGLTQALKDSKTSVRIEAAKALGTLGLDAQDAKPELSALLKDKDEKISTAAREAVEKIDAPPRQETVLNAKDQQSTGSEIALVNKLIPQPKAKVSFGQVSGLFQGKCINCHGKVAPKGDYDMSSLALLKAGGKTGPGIQAGKLDGLFWEQIATGRMPPKGQNPLSPEDKMLIQNWILDGARD